MGRFNLLDEPWISVIHDEAGNTKDVSLHELFTNSHEYKALGGDTKTQDFAVMRVLLAVLHTVFSRFKEDGLPYDYFKLGETYIPTNSVDEGQANEYRDELYDTWITLWEMGRFPNIVNQYLEKWREHFFLFDEKYPFFQVTKEDIRSEVLNKPSASEMSGKNINRLISESGNKISLFSPKNENSADKNKEKLSYAEIARWLITLQGYVGLSDKVIFGKSKYKASKGWLFDIGGIYLTGRNLFETLMLNFALPYQQNGNPENIQKPCWEKTGSELIHFYLKDNNLYTLAELYTTWSRAVYIDPEFDENEPFTCSIVKLPEIEHRNNFLEPMTLWRYNESGDSKGRFTPKKHVQNQSLWRSFALVTMEEAKRNDTEKDGKDKPNHRPGIIDWLIELVSRSRETGFATGICSVGMQDDGNATSWVPTDELFDSLPIGDFILTDVCENGWVEEINGVIDQTKKTIEYTYKNYLRDIKEIRNQSDDSFVSKQIEKMYFIVDKHFRQWLIGKEKNDDKTEKIEAWKSALKKLIVREAKSLFESGGKRDFIGIEDDEKGNIKNIATAFNRLMYYLNCELKKRR